MRILILGGTGFLGRHIAHTFFKEGHSVTSTSRHKTALKTREVPLEQWNGSDAIALTPLLKKADVVINLLGENIGKGRWTKVRKQNILQSRIHASNALVTALKTLSVTKQPQPHTLIQASACGYYGLWDNIHSAPTCTENTARGHGFLAEVCETWEKTVESVESLGTRTCIVRLAPVLGRHVAFSHENTMSPKHKTHNSPLAGFLASFTKPFRYYVGGIVGSGQQPVPWVHIDDVTAALFFLANNTQAQGIFNICSPTPESLQRFTQWVAHFMGRPAFIPIPAPLIRLALGDMAHELILHGQKAVPHALQELEFSLKYQDLESALQDCLASDT